MKVTEEAGVLARSERFFATPGTVARGLFYYITRAGHYYYDENYDFRDNCEIGASRKPPQLLSALCARRNDVRPH